MAKRKRPEARPEPDVGATTVMNDATRVAQQDALAPAQAPPPSSSTQFLAEAVENAEAANRTTVEGSTRSDDARVLNVPRSPPPMAPERRLSPVIGLLAVVTAAIATAAAFAWANGFFE